MIGPSKVDPSVNPADSLSLQREADDHLRQMGAAVGISSEFMEDVISQVAPIEPKPINPVGEIAWHARSGGDVYQVEKLETPVLRGAGMRTHRLWRNGAPCVGHQWCYSLEDAQWWAEWLIERDLKMQISKLKTRVLDLESRLSRERFMPQPY